LSTSSTFFSSIAHLQLEGDELDRTCSAHLGKRKTPISFLESGYALEINYGHSFFGIPVTGNNQLVVMHP